MRSGCTMIDIGRPFNGDALKQCLDNVEFDPRVAKIETAVRTGGYLQPASRPAGVALLVIFCYPSEVDHWVLVGDRRDKGAYREGTHPACVTGTVDQQ